MQQTIAFIGGGNMARALIGGLVKAGWPPDRITVADPDASQRALIQKISPCILAHAENREAVRNADLILFAVKPQIMPACATALGEHVQNKRPLIVSIVAGVRVETILTWLKADLPVVRCMPNTPALVGCGATALYASVGTSQPERDAAEQVMRSVGMTVWLHRESEIDVVTALSGSGPAYFFLLMEALEEAATKLGLSPETAGRLCVQTALGAARLAAESEDSRAQLRAKVTSKGGTTEKAIEVLERGGIRDLFEAALSAAATRARNLSDESERMNHA